MAAVALLLALLPRRTWLSRMAVAASAGACAYDAALLAPYPPLAAQQQVAAASCPDGNRLRLLEANAQMTNRHDQSLLNIVRRAAPDVAWCQETDAWREDELAPLAAEMPHGVAKPQPNHFGVHLFSRPPHVGQSTAERNAQLLAAALAARDNKEPHVVAGGMNAVPWEG